MHNKGCQRTFQRFRIFEEKLGLRKCDARTNAQPKIRGLIEITNHPLRGDLIKGKVGLSKRIQINNDE